MNTKQALDHAATAAGCDTATAGRIAHALARVMRERCGDLDSVAIPGFGTFVARKHDERVDTDASGRRTLVPPHIDITFNAGSRLRKQL